MANESIPSKREDLADRIAKVLEGLIAQIPPSSQEQADNPMARAQELISQAALKAAAVSGTLALPPGPIGIATILPDLYLIWRIQAQLVADIAAVFGKTALLRPETMVYCLFRHGGAQAVRDIVVRTGERVLIRRTSLRAMQRALRSVGVKITQRTVRSAVARWLPLIGAAGVAGYGYYDTWQVGQTAMELFSDPKLTGPGDEMPAAKVGAGA